MQLSPLHVNPICFIVIERIMNEYSFTHRTTEGAGSGIKVKVRPFKRRDWFVAQH